MHPLRISRVFMLLKYFFFFRVKNPLYPIMLNRLKETQSVRYYVSQAHPKMKFSPSEATTGMSGRAIVSILLPRIAWDLDVGGVGVGLLTGLGLVDRSFLLGP